MNNSGMAIKRQAQSSIIVHQEYDKKQKSIPALRQHSSNSEEILSFLSAATGSLNRICASDSLSAISTAFDEGLIDAKEKASLKDQLVVGGGFDSSSLIEKLDEEKQFVLLNYFHQRMLIYFDSLACSIYMEKFDHGDHYPYVLPCGHSLCKGCLSSLSKQQASKNICPIDRKPIGSNLILPPNYSLLNILLLKPIAASKLSNNNENKLHGPDHFATSAGEIERLVL
jgi:hypothetical protein